MPCLFECVVFQPGVYRVYTQHLKHIVCFWVEPLKSPEKGRVVEWEEARVLETDLGLCSSLPLLSLCHSRSSLFPFFELPILCLETGLSTQIEVQKLIKYKCAMHEVLLNY